MAVRPVTHARKDRQDDITHLGNPSEFWSPRTEGDIINDIRTRVHSYYVPFQSGTVQVVVRQGKYRQYLATEPDNLRGNNLDNLPSI